jgi:hypothetical protein
MASTLPKFPIPVPARGPQADLDRQDVPADALSESENVVLRNGEFKVRPGLTTFADDINERPTAYIQYVDQGGSRRVVKATTAGWFALGSGAWTDITLAGSELTGAATDLQVFRKFEKAGDLYLLGTNGKDAPKKWDSDPTNDYAAIAGSPPRAKCMLATFGYAVLLHLLSGGNASPRAIDVSADGDFDSGWGSTQVILLDAPGEISAAEELDEFASAVYLSEAIGNLIAQEATDPFRFDLKVVFDDDQQGPASVLAVSTVATGLQVYLASCGAVKSYNGAAVQDLPYRIQRHIARTANLSKINLAWSHYDSDRKEVWFVYPLQGSDNPNGGIILDRNNQYWPIKFSDKYFSAGAKLNTEVGLTIGDLTQTLGDMSQTLGEFTTSNALRRMVFGEIGGQSYQDIGFDDAGTAIPFYFETGLSWGKDSTRQKTITEIEHKFARATGSQEISVQVGFSKHGEDRTLDTARTIDVGNAGPYNSGHRKSAQGISLRYSGSATREVRFRGASAAHVNRGPR